MTIFRYFPLLAFGMIVGASAGCSHCQKCAGMGEVTTPAPLGALSDEIWKQQESNGEASDFVIHEHEFIGNSIELNSAGTSHVKQIAFRADSVPFPIIVEPSTMAADPDSKYGFPVHGDARLDHQRRNLIVAAMESMGVKSADERVVISPALTPGFESFEAQGAYSTFGFGGLGGGGGGRGGGGRGR